MLKITNYQLVNDLCTCALPICILFRQRIAKKQWWLKLRPLLRILAKHDSTYEEEGMYITVEEQEVDLA